VSAEADRDGDGDVDATDKGTPGTVSTGGQTAGGTPTGTFERGDALGSGERSLKVRQVGCTRFGATRTEEIMKQCYKESGRKE